MIPASRHSHCTLVAGGLSVLCVVAGAAGCMGELLGGGSGPGGGGNVGGASAAGGSAGTAGNRAPGGSPATGGTFTPPGPTEREPLAGPPTRGAGARRLTRQELARSLRRLLGADAPVDITLLPEDTLTPFDNDVLEQSPSLLLVESMEAIASDVAAWATATPRAAAGAAALHAGRRRRRRLLRPVRRALRPAGAAPPARRRDARRTMRELLSYAPGLGPFRRRGGGGAAGVPACTRSSSTGSSRACRPRPARPADRASRLASRLSFLLQGMTPDDALLAAAGERRARHARRPAGRRPSGCWPARRASSSCAASTRSGWATRRWTRCPSTTSCAPRPTPWSTGPPRPIATTATCCWPMTPASTASWPPTTACPRPRSGFAWVGYGAAPRRGDPLARDVRGGRAPSSPTPAPPGGASSSASACCASRCRCPRRP